MWRIKKETQSESPFIRHIDLNFRDDAPYKNSNSRHQNTLFILEEEKFDLYPLLASEKKTFLFFYFLIARKIYSERGMGKYLQINGFIFIYVCTRRRKGGDMWKFDCKRPKHVYTRVSKIYYHFIERSERSFIWFFFFLHFSRKFVVPQKLYLWLVYYSNHSHNFLTTGRGRIMNSNCDSSLPLWSSTDVEY